MSSGVAKDATGSYTEFVSQDSPDARRTRAVNPSANLPPTPTISGPSPTPFSSANPPAPRSRLQRLFRISRPKEARRALENLLSTSAPSELSPAAISNQLTAFGVRGASARKVVLDVFRQAFAEFIRDDEITDAEQKYLTDLRNLLAVNDSELKSLEEELLTPRFAAGVRDAIADDRISATERENLQRLRQRLTLDEQTAKGIIQSAAQDRLDHAAMEAIADARLSPDEMTALYGLAANLGVKLALDVPTRAAFERMQLLWRIDNGQLPTITVPINLQKNEVCHAEVGAIWYEHRTRTVRVNYGGPVASIRICKGLRYRVGSVGVHRITREELTEIDRGTLYLTSKRVIFDGQKKNTTIRLSSLLSFTPLSDGVILEKSAGRSPSLARSGDVELFQAMLSAALNAH